MILSVPFLKPLSPPYSYTLGILGYNPTMSAVTTSTF